MKKYEAIIAAKEAIANAELDIEHIDTVVYKIKKHSILLAVAFAAVIMSGSFQESLIDGWSFQLPSTKCCMENFGYAKYLVTREKSIPLDLYEA